MNAFLSLIIGIVIGWLASLAMRTETRHGILLDIAIGALGAVLALVLFGSDYLIDALLASGLGALIAVALLALGRRTFARRSH